MDIVASTAYIPPVDFVLAALWVAYTAVAFTAMNKNGDALKICAAALFVVTLVVAAGAGL